MANHLPKLNPNLFDNIIAAIDREKEFKQTRKILVSFMILLLVSVASLPFSLSFFVSQWKTSGTYYFIETAIGNVDVVVSSGQDLLLAILESFPFTPMMFLVFNLACLLFAVRLFLHRQGALLKYLKYNF